MLISVFTPSHDLRWIGDAYDSLRKQSLKSWEWVVVPNGDAARGDAGALSARIRKDPKVRIIAAPQFADNGKVGALKRFAASQCKGEVLVELDHDDMLAPQALDRIVRAVETDAAGFIYSDFVQLRADGTCPTFDPRWGWESYAAQIGGRDYTALRAFDPTPASLMHVWWAPNHVRAWTRAAYDAAGGHDPCLKVCDDVDLVARTYLAGVKFVHVPEPLYIYRLRAGAAANTSCAVNAEVQKLDQMLSNRHFYRLVDEWCRRTGLEKVVITTPGRSLPVEEGSVGVIRAYDCLHRVHPEHLPGLMNDFYLALAPGGWLMIRVPSTDSQLAFADPLARSHWNRASWWYYTHKAYVATVPGLNVRFQEARSWDAPSTQWERDRKQLCSHADLCCLKGQRQPGLQHI